MGIKPGTAHIGCDVPGCAEPHSSHGLCSGHDQRFRRTGSVQADKPIRKNSALPTVEKQCIYCKEVKPLSDFTPDRYSPNGRVASKCRRCAKEDRKERVQALARQINEYKLERGCADCGYDEHPMALHFDHLPGRKKRFDIGRAVRSASPAIIWAEIRKCEVVCANCHAVRTAERLGIEF